MKLHMTAIEESDAAMAQSLTSRSRGIDRMENHPDRIERCLVLGGAST